MLNDICRISLSLLMACIIFAMQAEAKRVALVIGNSAYEHVNTLENSKNCTCPRLVLHPVHHHLLPPSWVEII
jgi:hypothetical protein